VLRERQRGVVDAAVVNESRTRRGSRGQLQRLCCVDAVPLLFACPCGLWTPWSLDCGSSLDTALQQQGDHAEDDTLRLTNADSRGTPGPALTVVRPLKPLQSDHAATKHPPAPHTRL
jgi:hypothetical protein